MKFLIVGASGFIGRNIFEHIKNSGHEVVGTQNESIQSDLVFFDILTDKIKEKIGPGFFETAEKVFVVIAAALSQMDRCFTEKELSYKINVEKTIQLIEDVRRLGAIPVFISTSAIYNDVLGYHSEGSRQAPINEYGRHKQTVDQYLISNVPEAFIVRLDKIVSDDLKGGHLFAEWFQKIQENEAITCIDQLFSPTYVIDVAKAIACGCQLKLCGAYNVANPEFFTRVELAKQYMSAVGGQVDIVLKSHEEFNFADPRNKNSYLDGTKFIKETGMRFTSMREVFNSFLSKKRHELEAVASKG